MLNNINTSTYVYCFREQQLCGNEPIYYKIGMSVRPKDRLRELQVGNPRDFRLVFKIGPFGFSFEAEEIEQAIHRMLSPYSKRGEWFDFGDPTVLTAIYGELRAKRLPVVIYEEPYVSEFDRSKIKPLQLNLDLGSFNDTVAEVNGIRETVAKELSCLKSNCLINKDEFQLKPSSKSVEQIYIELPCEDNVEVRSPFRTKGEVYFLVSQTNGWKCGTSCKVLAVAIGEIKKDDLGNGNDEGPYGLSYIQSLPKVLLEQVRKLQPNFEVRNSSTADLSYYVNTCECGTFFGDFFLHLPDGPFFIYSLEESHNIHVVKFQLEDEVIINAEYNYDEIVNTLIKTPKH